ncbi:MAG: COG2426 family protein [bacterium]
MTDKILEALQSLPPPVVAIILAMLPILELRGAIPVVVGAYHIPVWKAYVYSVLGNIIPIIPILVFLEPLRKWLSERVSLARWFFDWLYWRTYRRGDIIQRYEALGLIVFVAIPLPMTGAWTGAVAALIFGIKFRLALPAIVLGVMIAGVVVSLATAGIVEIWRP